MTGANPNFSNYAEANRLRHFKNRKGVFLTPKREVYWPWVFSTINSDALIIVGNKWTAATYNDYNDKIFTVPVPYITTPENLVTTNGCQNKFVWFAGPGAVHKGLDLALEAVDRIGNDITLHVCGNLKREQQLIASYNDVLQKNDKIKLWGMVNPNDQTMHQICAESAFVLLPSCSEGSASSVITCMAKGLIPVVTKESGINLDGFGIEILEGSVEGVTAAMQKACALSIEEINKQRKAVIEYVMANHSPASFKNKLNLALAGIN
jgi:glycosyltransferase involved in cell wall biosynthesis